MHTKRCCQLLTFTLTVAIAVLALFAQSQMMVAAERGDTSPLPISLHIGNFLPLTDFSGILIDKAEVSVNNVSSPSTATIIEASFTEGLPPRWSQFQRYAIQFSNVDAVARRQSLNVFSNCDVNHYLSSNSFLWWCSDAMAMMVMNRKSEFGIVWIGRLPSTAVVTPLLLQSSTSVQMLCDNTVGSAQMITILVTLTDKLPLSESEMAMLVDAWSLHLSPLTLNIVREPTPKIYMKIPSCALLATDIPTLTDVISFLSKQAIVSWIEPAIKISNYSDISVGTKEDIAVPDVGDFAVSGNTNRLTSATIQSGRSNSWPFYSAGIDGTGQIVSIGDTGIDTTRCSFSNNKISKYIVLGGDNTDVADGHGTHTSGTLASYDTNVPDLNGVAYGAKIVFFDMAGSDAILKAPSSFYFSYYYPAYSAGSRTMSSSWGCIAQSSADTSAVCNTYNTWAQSTDQFQWDNLDFNILVSVGNSGASGSGTVSTPATAKNVIAVGAYDGTLSSSNTYTEVLPSWSATGPTRDQRWKPDLVAPGVNIVSVDADAVAAQASSRARNQCTTASHTSKSGTSMATPAVSGSVLLVRQYLQEGYYPGGVRGSGPSLSPTSALIKAILIHASLPLNVGSTIFPNSNAGFGRLELASALRLPASVTNTILIQDGAVVTGSDVSYLVDVQCNNNITITLVWTDAPAALNSATALVNDLDLTVTVPTGTVIRSNNGRGDNINNVEKILINSAVSGIYVVSVRGANVPSPHPSIIKQPFALVMTGFMALLNSSKYASDVIGQCLAQATVSITASTIILNGRGFSSNSSKNVVTLFASQGIVPSVVVTTATSTSLTIAIPINPITGASVFTIGARLSYTVVNLETEMSTVIPVVLGTVVTDPLTVNLSPLPVSRTATELSITGTGFSTSASQMVVSLLDAGGIPVSSQLLSSSTSILKLIDVDLSHATSGSLLARVTNMESGKSASSVVAVVTESSTDPTSSPTMHVVPSPTPSPTRLSTSSPTHSSLPVIINAVQGAIPVIVYGSTNPITLFGSGFNVVNTQNTINILLLGPALASQLPLSANITAAQQSSISFSVGWPTMPIAWFNSASDGTSVLRMMRVFIQNLSTLAVSNVIDIRNVVKKPAVIPSSTTINRQATSLLINLSGFDLVNWVDEQLMIRISVGDVCCIKAQLKQSGNSLNRAVVIFNQSLLQFEDGPIIIVISTGLFGDTDPSVVGTVVSAVVVKSNPAASLALGIVRLVISGSGFSPLSDKNFVTVTNTVYTMPCDVITSSSSTLTCLLSSVRPSFALQSQVFVNVTNLASGQKSVKTIIGTVVPNPIVRGSIQPILWRGQRTLHATVTGVGFAINATVQITDSLNRDLSGSVTPGSITNTAMGVTFNTRLSPQSPIVGYVYAVVTANGGDSGSRQPIGIIAIPSIFFSESSIPIFSNNSSIVVTGGIGFSDVAGDMIVTVVSHNRVVGKVMGSSASQLLIQLSNVLSIIPNLLLSIPLNITVINQVTGQVSPAIQVARVIATPVLVKSQALIAWTSKTARLALSNTLEFPFNVQDFRVTCSCAYGPVSDVVVTSVQSGSLSVSWYFDYYSSGELSCILQVGDIVKSPVVIGLVAPEGFSSTTLSPSTRPSTTSNLNRVVIVIILGTSIDINLNDIYALSSFKALFRHDIGFALGIDPSRIIVVSITKGSVVVRSIVETDDNNGMMLVSALSQQASDPSSNLRKGQVTKNIVSVTDLQSSSSTSPWVIPVVVVCCVVAALLTFTGLFLSCYRKKNIQENVAVVVESAEHQGGDVEDPPTRSRQASRSRSGSRSRSRSHSRSRSKRVSGSRNLSQGRPSVMVSIAVIDGRRAPSEELKSFGSPSIGREPSIVTDCDSKVANVDDTVSREPVMSDLEGTDAASRVCATQDKPRLKQRRRSASTIPPAKRPLSGIRLGDHEKRRKSRRKDQRRSLSHAPFIKHDMNSLPLTAIALEDNEDGSHKQLSRNSILQTVISDSDKWHYMLPYSRFARYIAKNPPKHRLQPCPLRSVANVLSAGSHIDQLPRSDTETDSSIENVAKVRRDLNVLIADLEDMYD